MIKFDTIKQALEFKTICPRCKSKLFVHNNDSLSLIEKYKPYSELEELKFTISYSNEDYIALNIYTENIKVFSYTRAIEQVVYSSPGATVIGNIIKETTSNWSGKLYTSVKISCDDCIKYEFILQLVFDLEKMKLIERTLNSECMRIVDVTVDYPAKVHTIKNIYTTNNTKYSVFSFGQIDSEDVLPLIPLDVDNPQITLDRIKKLLIFT